MIPKLYLSHLKTALAMDVAIYCSRDVNDMSTPASFQVRIDGEPFGHVFTTESDIFERFNVPVQGPGKLEIWGSINAIIKPFV